MTSGAWKASALAFVALESSNADEALIGGRPPDRFGQRQKGGDDGDALAMHSARECPRSEEQNIPCRLTRTCCDKNDSNSSAQ